MESAQTWVTKIGYLDFFHRQPSAFRTKTWEPMLRHRPVSWDDWSEYCIIRNHTENLC